ncbi:MAG: hypothetical protein B7O98_05335 [Zestosphaera tikiterensis]|uniref:Uncharacterized protein n=1 Tax=Zestosphaera tikiterensis TaxID=1973259 RepID=A0A2R7Y664_9CREN|nr:MAG: hypothetical protein B7O98_05335 [Zestosphaera tikiterensis]
MPSWKLHVKLARCLGVSEDVARFVNKLIDEPSKATDRLSSEDDKRVFYELIEAGFIGHDWSRGSKGRRNMVLTICSKYYNKEECRLAVDLHDMLDYIATLRNPRKLAEIILKSELFHSSGNMPIDERLVKIRDVLKSDEYKHKVEELAKEIEVKLDENKYSELIAEMVKVKAKELEIEERVLNYLLTNINEIQRKIADEIRNRIELAEHNKHISLDKWFKR